MNRIKTSVAVAVIGSVLTLAAASPAFAWHPQGKIVKKVQNITTGSMLVDANDVASAVAVKPGDTIKYAIEVRNDGAADGKGLNDMAATKMTDTLPVGVELVGSTGRTITENLGLIKPGQKVTKEYTLKVTSQTDGDVITNKACFTGNSIANDNPQSGCDVAIITVHVPVVPPAPTPVPTPTPPAPTPPMPTQLPHTGPEAFLGMIIGLGALTFAGYSYLQSRRVNG